MLIASRVILCLISAAILGGCQLPEVVEIRKLPNAERTAVPVSPREVMEEPVAAQPVVSEEVLPEVVEEPVECDVLVVEVIVFKELSEGGVGFDAEGREIEVFRQCSAK